MRARDAAGNWGNAAHLGPFPIDTTAPSNPTTINSPSHSTSVWSSDSTVDVNRSGATDSLSGVYGYSIEWSTSASTVPDTSLDTTGAGNTSGSLSTGSSWYFHIRTRDNAGNWNSGASHKGPFYIDTATPTAPTSASPNCTASSGAWQNTCSDPSFTWTGAGDSGSGVAGYYYYWGTDPNGTSGSYTTSAAYNPSAVGNPSTTYLRIQTRDVVGLVSNWVTLFTFMYDGSAPGNPGVGSSSHSLASWSSDPTVDVYWSGASDGSGSGINGYSFEWSTSASTIPDTSVDTAGTGTTSGSLSTGSSWYFHIRTRDNAGNWNSGATHYGPFYIDSSLPTAPTSASPNCTASSGAWQNTCSDPYFTWSGAGDSGLWRGRLLLLLGQRPERHLRQLHHQHRL